jgi:thymidylate synthase (FAD)
MKATYIDSMGNDLAVVNAARVSFNKHKETFGPEDEKLLRYLAKHGHWSPFAHAIVKFHFKAPIFVARQLVKHQVGMVWNELSRRYVHTAPELYWPRTWRKAAENVKQGSSDEEYSSYLQSAEDLCDDLIHEYNYLVNSGLCPEQARMILPQNTYTEWIWTGSVYAWARVFKQRTDPTAQKETQDLIKQIDKPMGIYFPVSWKVLTKEYDEN